MNNFDEPVKKAETDAEILDALQGVKLTQDEIRRGACGGMGLAFFRAYYAEDVRVKNKIIRETRKEGLLLLNDDIDLEDVQGELETRAKFMFVPLQRMIDAKEISSAEITVPEGQEETILEDETMRVKIRYVSRGYIREVEVDLGRAQPSD